MYLPDPPVPTMIIIEGPYTESNIKGLWRGFLLWAKKVVLISICFAFGAIKIRVHYCAKGIPVRLNIKADVTNINACNDTVEFPDFNIEKVLEPGDNIIEFTPAKTGILSYKCWMGMIYRKINDVDNLNDAAILMAELRRVRRRTAQTLIPASPFLHLTAVR